jgi:acyl carrier protein
MMAYDAFLARLLALLDFEPAAPISRYDELYGVVGLDSLQAFHLLIIVESLAGADVPPEEIPEIYTMQDAYAYYESLHTSATDNS